MSAADVLARATIVTVGLGLIACSIDANVATMGASLEERPRIGPPPVTGFVDAQREDVPPEELVEPAEATPTKALGCTREPPIERDAATTPTDADLLMMINDPKLRFGSASIGRPSRGALYGAIELVESEAIEHAGGYAWGTANAVHSLERAVRQVRACFPETPRLYVGDLSRERGGWLGPHASHQAGLDADVGWFYVTPRLWYVAATAKNLDVPRTRQMLIALVEGGNVEMIFIDRGVQQLLRRQKDEAPGPDVPPDDWFESPTHRDATIRHAWGHATHFHVRFTDPEATALGTRLATLLPPTHPLRRIALAANR